MNKLLLLWLSLSFSGSLVALTLILLKPILRRFSKTWQYYLWLLVILRLIVPFSPSVNIVGELFQRVETQLMVQNNTMENTSNINLSENTHTAVTTKSGHARSAKTSVAVNNFYFLNNHIVGTLWLSIAIILFLRKIVVYNNFVKAIKKKSKRINDEQVSVALQSVCTAMGIKKKVLICTNSLVQAPMIIGTINPMIIFPNEISHDTELLLILKHELTHYRRLDFLYKWLVEIVVCLHWFNPLTSWVRKQINKDCEFSCDEGVVNSLDATDRQTYGETLINSIVLDNIRVTKTVSLSLNKDGKLIKERLNLIMKYNRKSKLTILIAVVLTSLLLCGTAVSGAYTEITSDKSTKAIKSIQPQAETLNTQTVVYENVKMQQYEGYPELGIKGYKYVHDVKTNQTDKKIVSSKRGMMAFDKLGNALMIGWNGLDSDSKPSYFFLYDWDDTEILPNQTDDVIGGWTLNALGTDYNVDKIAYVLYCDKEITFEDDTVWTNPTFESWRLTYEGKKIDVNVLKNYYPYEQKIQQQ